ncbi:MAG: monovalent cation/H+ antiporter subunit D family protein [Firmicutes bacterium]|nr:monovalent cation/H+ antiporter subunit D family protein [Bacillota bacterium]
MLSANFPVLGIVALLMTAYLLPLVAMRRMRLGQGLAGLILALSAVYSALLFYDVLDSGPVYYAMGGWEAPWGIELAITPLSAFVMTVATGLTALVALSLPQELVDWSKRKAGWYITLLLLLTAALLGITMANDLFNLYVFTEVSTLAACALVSAKKDRNATDAAFKYLMLGAIGSGFILFAIGITYVITGHLNMGFAAAVFAASDLHPIIPWVMSAFYLVGFGVKAGLFPLHVWLPDAHSSAPTTASALLSGVVVKVFAVAMARVFFGLFGSAALETMGIAGMVRLMAAASILAGSAFAVVQTDIKRLLAYSTVAQVGYIFLGFGVGGVVGVAAALYHVLAHGLMKSILFLTAGKVIAINGTREISGFEGMGPKLPLPMGAFSLAALSMIGLPLLAGFATKWYLFNAGLSAQIYWLPVLIIISGLLNAAYFLPIVWKIWFGVSEAEATDRRVPGLLVLVAVLAVIGLVPGAVLDLLEQAAGWLIS